MSDTLRLTCRCGGSFEMSLSHTTNGGRDLVAVLEGKKWLESHKVCLTNPMWTPMMPTTPPTPAYIGCRVCGIGADGQAMGYVCNRSDCPTRITCGGAG